MWNPNHRPRANSGNVRRNPSIGDQIRMQISPEPWMSSPWTNQQFSFQNQQSPLQNPLANQLLSLQNSSQSSFVGSTDSSRRGVTSNIRPPANTSQSSNLGMLQPSSYTERKFHPHGPSTFREGALRSRVDSLEISRRDILSSKLPVNNPIDQSDNYVPFQRSSFAERSLSCPFSTSGNTSREAIENKKLPGRDLGPAGLHNLNIPSDKNSSISAGFQQNFNDKQFFESKKFVHKDDKDAEKAVEHVDVHGSELSQNRFLLGTNIPSSRNSNFHFSNKSPNYTNLSFPDALASTDHDLRIQTANIRVDLHKKEAFDHDLIDSSITSDRNRPFSYVPAISSPMDIETKSKDLTEISLHDKVPVSHSTDVQEGSAVRTHFHDTSIKDSAFSTALTSVCGSRTASEELGGCKAILPDTESSVSSSENLQKPSFLGEKFSSNRMPFDNKPSEVTSEPVSYSEKIPFFEENKHFEDIPVSKLPGINEKDHIYPQKHWSTTERDKSSFLYEGKKEERSDQQSYDEKSMDFNSKSKRKYGSNQGMDFGKFSDQQDPFKVLDSVQEAVVGLNYIEEYKKYGPNSNIPFRCTLCNSSIFHNNVVEHILGIKHKMNYLKEKNLSEFQRISFQRLRRAEKNSEIEKAVAVLEKLHGRGSINVIYNNNSSSSSNNDTGNVLPEAEISNQSETRSDDESFKSGIQSDVTSDKDTQPKPDILNFIGNSKMLNDILSAAKVFNFKETEIKSKTEAPITTKTSYIQENKATENESESYPRDSSFTEDYVKNENLSSAVPCSYSWSEASYSAPKTIDSFSQHQQSPVYTLANSGNFDSKVSVSYSQPSSGYSYQDHPSSQEHKYSESPSKIDNKFASSYDSNNTNFERSVSDNLGYMKNDTGKSDKNFEQNASLKSMSYMVSNIPFSSTSDERDENQAKRSYHEVQSFSSVDYDQTKKMKTEVKEKRSESYYYPYAEFSANTSQEQSLPSNVNICYSSPSVTSDNSFTVTSSSCFKNTQQNFNDSESHIFSFDHSQPECPNLANFTSTDISNEHNQSLHATASDIEDDPKADPVEVKSLADDIKQETKALFCKQEEIDESSSVEVQVKSVLSASSEPVFSSKADVKSALFSELSQCSITDENDAKVVLQVMSVLMDIYLQFKFQSLPESLREFLIKSVCKGEPSGIDAVLKLLSEKTCNFSLSALEELLLNFGIKHDASNDLFYVVDQKDVQKTSSSFPEKKDETNLEVSTSEKEVAVAKTDHEENDQKENENNPKNQTVFESIPLPEDPVTESYTTSISTPSVSSTSLTVNSSAVTTTNIHTVPFTYASSVPGMVFPQSQMSMYTSWPGSQHLNVSSMPPMMNYGYWMPQNMSYPDTSVMPPNQDMTQNWPQSVPVPNFSIAPPPVVQHAPQQPTHFSSVTNISSVPVPPNQNSTAPPLPPPLPSTNYVSAQLPFPPSHTSITQPPVPSIQVSVTQPSLTSTLSSVQPLHLPPVYTAIQPPSIPPTQISVAQPPLPPSQNSVTQPPLPLNQTTLTQPPLPPPQPSEAPPPLPPTQSNLQSVTPSTFAAQQFSLSQVPLPSLPPQ